MHYGNHFQFFLAKKVNAPHVKESTELAKTSLGKEGLLANLLLFPLFLSYCFTVQHMHQNLILRYGVTCK